MLLCFWSGGRTTKTLLLFSLQFFFIYWSALQLLFTEKSWDLRFPSSLFILSIEISLDFIKGCLTTCLASRLYLVNLVFVYISREIEEEVYEFLLLWSLSILFLYLDFNYLKLTLLKIYWSSFHNGMLLWCIIKDFSCYFLTFSLSDNIIFIFDFFFWGLKYSKHILVMTSLNSM